MEKPIAEGLEAAAGGIAAMIVIWLVTVIRTTRAVLREHRMLER